MDTIQVLYLDFIDLEGRKRSLSIEDPSDDLTPSQIADAMDLIILQDLFENKLVEKEGARIVTRTIEDLAVA